MRILIPVGPNHVNMQWSKTKLVLERSIIRYLHVALQNCQFSHRIHPITSFLWCRHALSC